MASPLSKSLQCPLREAQHNSTFYREVIRQIWSLDLTAQEYRQDADLYKSYFTHVFWELCYKAGGGDSSIRDLTYNQIFGIVQILKLQTWTKAATKEFLQRTANPLDSALTERAVNLAAALLVPLNFKNSGGARRGEVISWDENETLSDMLAKRLDNFSAQPGKPQNTCASCAQNGLVRYAKNFNARQLSKIAGFEIIWTSNLVDHLLLQDQDDSVKVHIFHQLRLLQNHSSITSAIIPDELVSETLDTIALMVPRTDRRVRKWYKKHQKRYELDPDILLVKYLDPEHRTADHFQYWGARLTILKRAFDDHEPNGPLQWWRDDRKPVQWWTFWIAALVLVLTIVFGFTQSITSILQVTKS